MKYVKTLNLIELIGHAVIFAFINTQHAAYCIVELGERTEKFFKDIWEGN